jgi:competence protein ComEA
VARRLELLGAELAVVRGRAAVATDESTHTRVRAGREPAPEVLPAAVPVPGRHAARGRLTLGAAQLAVVAVLVLAALAGTAWWVLRGAPPEVVAPAEPRPADDLVSVSRGPSPSGSPSGGGGGSVTVDVAGKVRRPGIAVLDAGARVVDALEAAGGARDGVDLTGLNLARVLVDGEQILVGLATPTGVAATVTGGTSPVATLVNLNTADQVALESLPDVGPVTAQSILAWRTEHGAFTAVDQLLDVDGIGEVTLAKLTPYVTL